MLGKFVCQDAIAREAAMLHDALERYKESKKLNGDHASVPRPDNEYLRRISDKAYKTKNEIDDEASNERVH